MRETHLAAIESEEFDALGGDVYVRGFITAYARFLGLDPRPLLDAHRVYRNGQEQDRVPRRRGYQGPAPEPADVRVRSARVAVLLVLVVVVTVALVVVGLWGDGATSTGTAAGWL